MNYKKRRLLCVILIGNVIILGNLLSVKPVSSFVAADENFHYEYSSSESYRLENLENDSAIIEEYSEDWSDDIHIIELNVVEQTILYERTDEDHKSNYSRYYGWDSYISNYFEFTDVFYIQYSWDLHSNKPILRSFNFYFYSPQFIENNWSAMNTHLSNLLDDSLVVDTVTNPDDLTEHDITFGDFLGSLKSYKIQGRSTISDAQKQFTDSTTKWSFKFDLSGVLHRYDHFNSTFGYSVYLPIDKVTIESTVEYTVDGARKYQNEIYEYENVYSDEELKITQINNYESALGKLPIQLSVSYLAFIPAILFIVLVVRIRNKKK